MLGLLDILPPTGHKKDWKDVYIVSELMDTDLHYIIHSKQPLTDEHFKYFLYQVSTALTTGLTVTPTLTLTLTTALTTALTLTLTLALTLIPTSTPTSTQPLTRPPTPAATRPPQQILRGLHAWVGLGVASP